MSILSSSALRLSNLASRWVPDAFTIACGLTVLVFALGVTAGGASVADCLVAWGDGIWTLLSFAMQMCLVVFCGYLVAVSRPAGFLLDGLARLARGPRSAVALVAAASMLLCWVHWGMGLITSAVLVSRVAAREPRADFRLLVAAAYLGLGTTWHAGPSGTVPLLLATADTFMVEAGLLDATVPLSATIFTPKILGFVGILLLVLPLLAAALHPPADRAVTLSPAEARRLVELPERPAPARTPAGRLEHTPWPNVLVGGAGLVYLGLKGSRSGLVASLDLNTVNLAFLSLAILLHGTPAALAAAVRDAARPLHGIVLQFPLYAGMFGIISGTDLAGRAASLLVDLSTPGTYPLVTWAYSSVLNYFVPSGGSKWVIEAPYLLEAASRLGVGVPRLAMAYAFGDMGTNLVQPFWAIPLLAVARIEFREILGFEVILFLAYATLSACFVGLLL
ncbi:MAG: short-chain fatty acid transporter [Deltaproteobacteria bacterium]|nr:short-chain fatty acid transporter [Deltaproteobacteria bacterium]